MKLQSLALLAICLTQVAVAQKKSSSPAPQNWIQETSSKIHAIEYGYRSNPDASLFNATNSKQQLLFEVGKSFYKVSAANNQDWTVRFFIKEIGGIPVTANEGGRFIYHEDDNHLAFRNSLYTVRYSNDDNGMRQDFVILKKPARGHTVSVKMELATDLDIKAYNQNQLAFFTKGNEKDIRLLYDGLKVFDAAGRILPSQMNFDNSSGILELQADAVNAVYPVTIDPLNRTPEWTSSADGILPGLLTNLQLQVQTLYGHTVAGLGDINGDGYDDVAVSAPGMADVITGTGSLTGVGAVFIYLGSPGGLPSAPSKVLQPNTALDGALFGYSVDAGDITGDGKNDIIIGAPMDRYQTTVKTLLGSTNAEVKAGKVYVYRSEDLFSAPNPSPFLQIKLQGQDYFYHSILHSNININALFGYSLAVTPDMNGDNKADILIGSPAYLGIDILSAQSGACFVYYSNNLSTTSPDQLNTPDPTLLGLPLLPLANTSGLLFGYSVDAAGDYNNDGKQDVVVGAPAGIDLSSLGGIFSGQFLGGSAYIYYGTGSGINPVSNTRLQADPSGLLSNAANLFGFEVKGAKNAQGVRTGHVLIGAPNGAVISNVIGGLQVKAGQLHVFKKKPGAAGNYWSDQVIASPRSSSILSILAGQTINISVLYASAIDNMLDVNCDNIGDIIVGEPLSTAVPFLGANVVGGAAYIYLGNADGSYQPAPYWDLNITVSPLLGVNASSLLGYSVAGAGYVKGRSQGVRSLVGGPSNCLDFGAGLLNLGNTLGVLFDFTFDDNGLGKSYTFPFQNCQITLPAELVEFKGQKIQTSVLLNWLSVSEDNLDIYELQRSNDARQFSTIALAIPKGSTYNEYSYRDDQPLKGMNYYRLKMKDEDGSISYSSIVAIQFNTAAVKGIRISPNPVAGDIHAQISGQATGVYQLEILNGLGQVIISRQIMISQENQTETIRRPSGIKAGSYWMRLVDGSGNRVGFQQLIIQ